MERAVFRPLRDAVAGRDARRHLRGRVPAPEHRAARVRPARQARPRRSATSTGRSRSARRRHPQDHDRRDRRRGRLPRRCSRCCSSGRRSACTCARPSMDFRTARLLGVSANRVIGSPCSSRRSSPRRWRDPDRAEPARHARLRAPRHDHRARRRRRRRHEPAPVGDARRLRDRLRRPALARRRAADRPEPVPAVARLRPRHPRPAGPPGGPVRARRRAPVERV